MFKVLEMVAHTITISNCQEYLSGKTNTDTLGKTIESFRYHWTIKI